MLRGINFKLFENNDQIILFNKKGYRWCEPYLVPKVYIDYTEITSLLYPMVT